MLAEGLSSMQQMSSFVYTSIPSVADCKNISLSLTVTFLTEYIWSNLLAQTEDERANATSDVALETWVSFIHDICLLSPCIKWVVNKADISQMAVG